MNLFHHPIAVLDVETTGLPRDAWAHPIELGAVLLDTDGTEIASFSSLMCPPVLDDRADEALRINQIDRLDVAKAPRPSAVRQDFTDLLTLHKVEWVTSFNVAFDREMCRRMGFAPEWPKWGRCIQALASAAMGPANLEPPGNHDAPIVIDGTAYRPARLSKAAQFFGVQPEGDVHRALTDAVTAARVLVAMRRNA